MYEAIAAGILDTFKILNKADVTTRLAQEAAQTEPSPLPQQPVAQRLASDADGEGLHGCVKTVLTEVRISQGPGQCRRGNETPWRTTTSRVI